MHGPKWLVVFFLFTLLITRFWDIGSSARFTRDESSDIARMHEYWTAKKITLVGPISSDNVKVFGSLTYYMLMPFAVIGNFSAESPAYGTALFGVITAVIIFIIIYQGTKNTGLLVVSALLLVISYPLIESSRWAWNPHLMLFWISLGLWLSTNKKPIPSLLTTFFLGLSIHNHYIAIVPVAIYTTILCVKSLIAREWIRFAMLVLGITCALSPFVLFDLRHPPGLFFSTYLTSTAPNIEVKGPSLSYPVKLLRSLEMFGYTLIRNQLIANIALIFSLFILLSDLVERNWKTLFTILPTIGLVVAMLWMDNPHTRYFLSVIGFYYVWIMSPRKNYLPALFQKITIVVLVIGSFITLPKVFIASYQPAAGTVTKISNTIQSLITANPGMKNINITTDASVDSDMLAEKYRDYLSIRGISFKAASEYDTSENLLIVSQGTINDFNNSQSLPLLIFRSQKLQSVMPVANTDWKIYWYSY